MRSMTGFATYIASPTIGTKNISIEVQLKSVNSKGCDVQFKMSSPLLAFEIDFIKYLKARFKRGTIIASIWLKNEDTHESSEIVFDVAMKYYEQLEELRKKLNISHHTTVRDLVVLPGVVSSFEQALIVSKNDEDSILDVVKQAADLLEIELEREGKGIHTTLTECLRVIERVFFEICSRVIVVTDLKRKKLEAIALEAAKSFQTDIGYDNNAAMIEVFRLLEKSDIAEEIQRFESHLKRIKELIDSSIHEKGRHADFIIQELFREANTIGAKCGDVEISHLLIAVKIELEKIREQLCNVA